MNLDLHTTLVYVKSKLILNHYDTLVNITEKSYSL